MSNQGNLSFFTAARLFAKFVASTSPTSKVKSKGGAEKPAGHFVTHLGHVFFIPDGEIKGSAHAHDLAKRSGMSDHGAKALAKAHGEGRITTTSHLVETARKAKSLAGHGLKDTIAVKTALDTVKPKSERGSASVKEMSPKDIEADPGRFQYKVNVGASGTNSELKSVGKWNENLGGVILAWKDPADGKTYVINGHHRLELAQRLGVDKIAVRNISAPDAAAARYVGAVANIAEGRGTAIDAGKLLRDDKVTPEKLAEDGVSLKGKLASDGLALSKLPEVLWNKAFKGELSVNRAAIIGGSGLGQSDQILLSQTAEKQEKGGKRLTDKEVGELAEQIKNAGTATVTTSSLFGEESMSQNLFVEKAQLSSYLKDRLGKDRRLFGFVGKEGRADTLARAGNTINVSESQRIAEHASQMEDVFSHLAYRSGPVADALSRAAGRLAQGGSSSEIKAKLYEEVHQAVAQTLGKSVEAHSLPDVSKEPEDKHTISMFMAGKLFTQFVAEFANKKPLKTPHPNRTDGRWITKNGAHVFEDKSGTIHPSGHHPLAKTHRTVIVSAHPDIFPRLGIPVAPIKADLIKLDEKHQDQFTDPDDVKKHIEHVLSAPTHVLPGEPDQPGHVLVVRRNGSDKASVLDMVISGAKPDTKKPGSMFGGHYNIRSAYTLDPGQLATKIAKAPAGWTANFTGRTESAGGSHTSIPASGTLRPNSKVARRPRSLGGTVPLDTGSADTSIISDTFKVFSLFAKFAAEVGGGKKPTLKAIEAARRQHCNESDSFCPDCGAVYEWSSAEDRGRDKGSCNQCGGHNPPVDGKLAIEADFFADFSTADFTEGALGEGSNLRFINVPALLSRTGNYTDKGIHLTPADFDRAAASVSPAAPVKMNMAHLKRGSVLDDAGLGEIHRTWRQGQELWGEIAVPQWLASLARERGLKLPVSAEWDIKTKTLRGCAWERTPRIEDARAVL